jgi:hypothetical protein
MFVLGHAGIGSALARPWTKARPLAWVLLGTQLPDLIDKPLYYALSWVFDESGASLGLISGTRTFGHTLIALCLAWWATSRRAGSAVAIGAGTHLVLDSAGDLVAMATGSWSSGKGPWVIAAILWPLLGTQFPIIPHSGVVEHVAALNNWWTLAGELAGGALLVRLWRQRRRGPAKPRADLVVDRGA